MIECEIKNDLVLSELENLRVRVPSIECILGDKLTAFAAHTTRIPLNRGKDRRLMKIYVDVYACPVVRIVEEVAIKYELSVTLYAILTMSYIPITAK